jgi:hypothetical protein
MERFWHTDFDTLLLGYWATGLLGYRATGLQAPTPVPRFSTSNCAYSAFLSAPIMTGIYSVSPVVFIDHW